MASTNSNQTQIQDVGHGEIDLKMSSDKRAKKAMKAMDLNGDGVIDSNEVVAYAQKGERSRRCNYVLVIALFVVIAAAVVIIMMLFNENAELKEQTKSDACTSIGEVEIEILGELDMESVNLNSTEVFNLTDSERNALLTAFDTFDTNNDDAWDLDEFEDYLLFTMKTDDVFDTIDIDGDGVWSFREMIAFLKALDGSSTYVSNIYNYLLFPATIERYDLGNDSDHVMFEYAAALLFELYDPYYKGYVTLEQYLLHNANSIFVSMDINHDGLVLFEEFINSSFSIGNLKLISVSGILDTDNYFNTSNVTSLLQLTEAGVLASEIYDCPNMNLMSNYNEDLSSRRRLGKWTACAGSVTGCVGASVGCAICIKFSLGACGPPCAIGIGSVCGSMVGVCATSGSCFSADSTVKVLKYDEDGMAIIEELVRNVKVGNYILTQNGFERVIHSAHYISEDNNETLVYHRHLCYEDDKCIAMTYSHLIYTGDNMDILKPASDMKIGDIIYVSYPSVDNQSEFHYKKVRISLIKENMVSQMRNIFTESGTIVVDNVVASSYTGTNKYDAYVQHAALKSFAYIISYYDANLLNDEYEMYKLRNFVYYNMIKPFNSFINAPKSLSMMAIATIVAVTTRMVIRNRT